jgi:MFS family permease
VEHPCPGCGSPVENSEPFCPICGASQIRFSRSPASAEGVHVETAVAVPVRVSLEIGRTIAARPPALGRDAAIRLRSAAAAGAIAAVLSAVPLGFFLALPLAGFLAVVFYRRHGFTEPSPAAGFRLGALAGLFAFLIFLVLTALETVIFHARDEFRQIMIEGVRRAELRNPDPQARQILDYFMTPPGLILMAILGAIFLCVVFVVLSGIGGTVSATVRRRKPRF